MEQTSSLRNCIAGRLTPTNVNLKSLDNLKFNDPETLRNLYVEKKFTLARIRHKRNQFLSESDWTQVNDVPFSESKKEEWKKYRQELRDITENLVVEIDMDIKWPTKPS